MPLLIFHSFKLEWKWNLRSTTGKPVIRSGNSAATRRIWVSEVHRRFLWQTGHARQSIHLKQHLIDLILDLGHRKLLKHITTPSQMSRVSSKKTHTHCLKNIAMCCGVSTEQQMSKCDKTGSMFDTRRPPAVHDLIVSGAEDDHPSRHFTKICS